MNIKKLFVYIFVFKFSFFASSWSYVLPGKVISEPILTSYGFCLIIDAQEICGFSDEGKLLWERPLSHSKKAISTCLFDDFIAVITNSGKTLNLLNPSGCILWSKNLNFECNKKPLSGLDGRFFITGKNIVSCFGIDGEEKWSIITPDQNNMMAEPTENGSILIFFENSIWEVSPFGEIIQKSNTNPKKNYFSQDFQLKYKIESNTFEITNIYEKNKYIFKLNDYNENNILSSKLTSTHLFLANNEQVSLYSLDGNQLYKTNLNNFTNNDWNYVFLSNKNYLIFCKNDWNIEGYEFYKTTSKNDKSKILIRNYDNYLYGFSDFITPEIQKTRDFLNRCETFREYITSKSTNMRPDQTIFDTDSRGTNEFLFSLASFSSVQSSSYIAEFLQNSTDKINWIYLLKGVGKNGYDPEGKILNAIDKISRKTLPNDNELIQAQCDAIYSICKFMGKKAFNSKGKNVLSRFIAPSFSIKSRNYTRETLKKISKLDL